MTLHREPQPVSTWQSRDFTHPDTHLSREQNELAQKDLIVDWLFQMKALFCFLASAMISACSCAVFPYSLVPGPCSEAAQREAQYLVGLSHLHCSVTLSISSRLLSGKKCSIWKQTHALSHTFISSHISTVCSWELFRQWPVPHLNCTGYKGRGNRMGNSEMGAQFTAKGLQDQSIKK